jgi:hypothetical protein
MKDEKNDYYVYVYIDPRNYEEFYYGKGRGNRKYDHLSDEHDSEKTNRIKAIKKDALEPIIKVIAKDLTEDEAFLIEKTLIWKLRKTLLNIATGNFAKKFRPHDTFHLELSGFDFKNGLYYVNIGECAYRCWEDCKKYGFIAAGQGEKWSNPLRKLQPGDIVIGYLKKHGYVGVGRVKEKALKINDFRYKGKTLREVPLKITKIFENSNNRKTEYLLNIDWIKAVDAKDAKWKKKSGLYATESIKTLLDKQPKTITFIEKEFNVNLKDLRSAA